MIESNYSNNNSCFANAFVIVLLPLLFLVGLVAGYLDMIPLKVELHTLLIITFIYVVFMFFIRHNANYIACHMRGTFFHMEVELQNQLKDNDLTIMGKTKSTLNIYEFMEEYYRDIRNNNFARVASSVFPMLGILGTFIAIAISMPDFTVKDLDALDKEISVLLSGIGTAFYASIYGITLSLIWTYFEKRGMSKVDKNLYDIERLYTSQVWRSAELIKHEHLQQELKDKEVIKTLKDTFDMDFIRDMNEQYLTNYTHVVNTTTESFNILTESMKEVTIDLSNTLNRIHSRQESINAVENIKSNIEGFNANAENLQKSMKTFDRTVEHTFTKIDSEMGQVIEQLSNFAFIISEQNQIMIDKMYELDENRKDSDA